jgi:hypothetical protein
VRGHDVSNIDDVSKQCCHPHLVQAPSRTTNCCARRIRAVPYGWNGPVPGDPDASWRSRRVQGSRGSGSVGESVCLGPCVRILGARSSW